MECDLCGAPAQDPQRDQQQMHDDRTYAQAMGHLSAGNWNQAMNLLRPLLEQHPTDTRLYLAVLRAATQDFRDMDMGNTANRAAAADAWDKLVRFNGVTGEMLRYSRRRYEKNRERLCKRRNWILMWNFAAAFCSIAAGACFGAADHWTGLLCAGGLVCCLYKVCRAHPIEVIRQLASAAPEDRNNPFI